MDYTRETYIEMLSYMRPAYTRYNHKFNRRYIQPVLGAPDQFGNYIKIIGDKPKISFMAHHDTVHYKSGRTSVKVEKDVASCYAQNCLGADDTSGVFIILSMIAANVPGVYVIHAAEEIGCVGSRALVNKWESIRKDPNKVSEKTNGVYALFDHIDFAISLDRKGVTSIVTHQLGIRTCSDEFATSLSEVLGGGFFADSGGVYTDSNEYRKVIPECTNLSVGYYNMHSNSEYQDLNYLDYLVKHMIEADWSKLVKARDPSVEEYEYGHNYFNRFGGYEGGAKTYKNYPVGGKSSFKGNSNLSAKESAKVFLMSEYGDDETENDYYDCDFGRNTWEMNHKSDVTLDLEVSDIIQVIDKYPEEVAQILVSIGYSLSGLIDDCDNLAVKNNKSYGRVMNF